MEIIGERRKGIVPFRCRYLVLIVIEAVWKEAFKSLDNNFFIFFKFIDNAIAISCYLFNQATRCDLYCVINVLP